MDFTRAGIILLTENCAECVAFYRDVLGLDVLFQIDRPDERLAIFALGGTYLMIEPGGRAHAGAKTVAVSPVKLRFNVADVQGQAGALASKGVEVEVRRHEWGTTAEFSDPDGNRRALRSDKGFG